MSQIAEPIALPLTGVTNVKDIATGIDLRADRILDIVVGLQADLVDVPDLAQETGRYSVYERFNGKLKTVTELVMARVIQGGHLLAVLKTHPPRQGTVSWYRYQAMLAETVGVEQMHTFLSSAQASYAAELTAGLPDHCTYGSNGWQPTARVYEMVQGLAMFGRGMTLMQTPTNCLLDGFGMDGGLAGLSGEAMLITYQRAGVQRVYVHGAFTDSLVYHTVKACLSHGFETIVMGQTTDALTAEAYQQGLAEIKAAGATII